MTHQCPKCELKFTWITELDDHCRTDHPEFHHDYPASVRHDYTARAVRVAGHPAHSPGEDAESAATVLGTYWNER